MNLKHWPLRTLEKVAIIKKIVPTERLQQLYNKLQNLQQTQKGQYRYLESHIDLTNKPKNTKRE